MPSYICWANIFSSHFDHFDAHKMFKDKIAAVLSLKHMGAIDAAIGTNDSFEKNGM